MYHTKPDCRFSSSHGEVWVCRAAHGAADGDQGLPGGATDM